jgi:hypothetical protein
MSSIFAGLDGVAEKEQAVHADSKHVKKSPASTNPPPLKRQRVATPTPVVRKPKLPKGRKFPPGHGDRPVKTKKSAPRLSIPSRDPNYRVLLAYGRNALLGPLLASKGYPLTVKTLKQIPFEELAFLVSEIDEVLDGELKSDTMDDMMKSVLQSVEFAVASRSRVQLQGTTDACFSDPKWRNLFERAKIKAGFGVRKINPAMELLLLTATTAKSIHEKNSHTSIFNPVDFDAPAQPSEHKSAAD